jgi:DNA adenine methylase
MNSSQLSFLKIDTDYVVNVSKIPQRSPFRYPGGKTWLVPHIRRWLSSLTHKPSNFIEPFAGGGIIGLTVAFENYADHVTLVEIDPQIAAVWKTMLNRNASWLANRIANFDLNYENAKNIISDDQKSTRALAFQTILKNRIYHGGILAEGSGMLKNGENGKGINSRWYPETLKKRILDIANITNRLTFIEADGFSIMKNNASRNDVVFFIDPPYTAGGKKAGKRLYTHFHIDHEELFQIASSLSGDYLMTYDNAPEVRALAAKYGLDTRLVAMQNTHHSTMKELLIGKNLDWID